MKIRSIPDGVYDLSEVSYDSNSKLVKYFDGSMNKAHAVKLFKDEIVRLIGDGDIPQLSIQIGKNGKRTMGQYGSMQPLFGPVYTKFNRNPVKLDKPVFFMDLNEAYNEAYKTIKKRFPNHSFGLEPSYSYDAKDKGTITIEGRETGYLYGDLPVYAYSYRTRNKEYTRHIKITCEDWGLDYPKRIRKALNNMMFGFMSVDCKYFIQDKEGTLTVKNGKVVDVQYTVEPRMVPNPNRNQVKHVLHYMIVDSVYQEMMTLDKYAICGNRDDAIITDRVLYEEKLKSGKYKCIEGVRGWISSPSCFCIEREDGSFVFKGSTKQLKEDFPELKETHLSHHQDLGNKTSGISFQQVSSELQEEEEAANKDWMKRLRWDLEVFIQNNYNIVSYVDSSVAGGGKTTRQQARLSKGDSLCTFNIKRQQSCAVDHPDVNIVSMKKLLHHYDPFGVKDKLGYEGEIWKWSSIKKGSVFGYDEMQDLDQYCLAVIIALCIERNLRLELNGDIMQDINKKQKKLGSVNFNLFAGVTERFNVSYRCGRNLIKLVNTLCDTDLTHGENKSADLLGRQKLMYTINEAVVNLFSNYKYLTYHNKDGRRLRPDDMFTDSDGILCYKYTCHKQKGEEYNGVIIDIRRSMDKKILYTLLTRGLGNVIILCSEKQEDILKSVKAKRI